MFYDVEIVVDGNSLYMKGFSDLNEAMHDIMVGFKDNPDLLTSVSIVLITRKDK